MTAQNVPIRTVAVLIGIGPDVRAERRFYVNAVIMDRSRLVVATSGRLGWLAARSRWDRLALPWWTSCLVAPVIAAAHAVAVASL